MATSPAPDAAAPPGMCPGIAVLGGGGGSGDGDGDGSGGKDGSGGDGSGDGKDGSGGGKSAASGCTKEGEPVDVATGAVISERVDFELQGVISFIWKCTYLSSACERNDARIGHGWRHSFSHRIEERRRAVIVVDDGGVEHSFEVGGVGVPIRQAFGRTLTRNADGTFTLFTREDGLFRDFTPARTEPRAWLLSAVRDDHGNTIAVRYGDDDAIVDFVDTVGRTIRVRYGASAMIASLEVMRAPTLSAWVPLVSYEHSADLDQVRAIDAIGHARVYRYAGHLLTSWTDRVGFTVHYVYDGAWRDARCIATWGALDGPDPAIDPVVPGMMNGPTAPVKVRGVHHRVLVYDDDLTEAYDTRGGVRRYFHNALGTMDKIVGAGGGVATQVFDERGNRTRLEDGEGAVWQWTYDERDRLLTATDPLGRTTRYTYGEHFLPTDLTAPNGASWTFTHDRYGRQTRVIDPLGASVEYVFDERGLLCATKREGVTVVTSKREWNGQVGVFRDTQGETRFQYDHWGRLLSVKTKEGYEAHYQYNDRDDLVARRDVRGLVTRYEYDGERNLVAVHAPDGTVRRARYGGNGWLTEVIDAGGASQRLLYDYEGEIVSAWNQRGEAYRFEYDLESRLVREHHIDGRTVAHRYDLAGQRVRKTGASGDVTAYTYDLAGNMLQQEYADGTLLEYEYDDLDFVVKARSPGGVVELQRDACGHVLKEVLESARGRFESASTYHPQGYRVARTIGADTVAYERDRQGQAVARVFDGVRRQELRHDVMGRVAGFSYAPGLKAELTYEATGKVQSLKVTRPRDARKIDDGLTELAYTERVIDRSYEYTTHQELAAVHDNVASSTVTYAYDEVGRLLERTSPAGAEPFRNDETGNPARGGSALHRAAGDQVDVSGDVTLAYDGEGRVIAKREHPGSSAREWRYAWDSVDQLAMVTTPDGEKWSFEYDAFGRRTRKVGGDGAETLFFWDGNSLALEVRRPRGGPEQRRTYVFEEAEAVRPIAQKVSGKWFDYVTTPIGTPTELVDDTGQVGWAATFTAYGMLEAEQKTETDTPLRFPGQYADPETGLFYNRFRYYDPLVGRYMSPDPISVEGGLNEYAYARNPIGWIDPLGLANGAALNSSMVAAGQAGAPAGFATHHVIPETLYNDPAYSGLLGTNPHTANNGIQLPSSQAAYDAHKLSGTPPQPPGQTIHSGGHAGYTNSVRQELDRIKGLPPCKQQPALTKLRNSLKKDLQNGTSSHTNSQGNTVNGLNRHGNVVP
jgi:RHS repeat-associated protein